VEQLGAVGQEQRSSGMEQLAAVGQEQGRGVEVGTWGRASRQWAGDVHSHPGFFASTAACQRQATAAQDLPSSSMFTSSVRNALQQLHP
jgi:proteasome lid subunit RPN8/RPN11